ncbi:MAG: alpha-glucuronidase family glycosyl hydrolase [Mangrovibacterium sp.]
MKFKKYYLFCYLFCLSLMVMAEDGAELWLRYESLPENLAANYRNALKTLAIYGQSETLDVASDELQKAFLGLTGHSIKTVGKFDEGSIILSLASNKSVSQFFTQNELRSVGDEGYLIRTIPVGKGTAILITANTDAGILYGTFELIRLLQTGQPVHALEIVESPKYDLRLLNHWDNLNGTVERGYAGHSIWWNYPESDEVVRQRYVDYARANASVGINGTVLNNVNASPQVLTDEYIRKFANVADVLRPYHLKVYMSVNFSSPVVLDKLPTADPMNAEVAEWWKNKADEIYRLIPDFGGFLVKANSEGQPGPQDFGRTHADGANMLAAALKPHGGVVMWRAFVYSPSDTDRAKQAYNEFMPFDGKFAANVIVQIKNGPVDFQPREPFSPLFGAMQHTPAMIEFQLTQEYLGFSNHLAYLAPMQKECFESDTWGKGKGSTVARSTDGSLFPAQRTAISAVANIGRDTNWCGHQFAQANWYAYGRLAWNHELASDELAREWVKMTFTLKPEFEQPVVDIMMRSREAVVNYMTPLGLHHLMGWSHHHGPEPWCEVPGAREDWLPSYFHKASENGIGFDRSETGSKATEQYFSPVKELYNNLQTCPDELLLWFHHLPWDYRMKSGKTLWEELCYHYYAGVEETRLFQQKWDALNGIIDAERFAHVQQKLKIQTTEAIWWRDACLLYFQTFSKMPIPLELERPLHDLDELKKIKFDMTHHN